MYAKYSINVWFVEVRNFYKEFAKAIRHMQMLFFIPTYWMASMIFAFMQFMIASPKFMRINEKGEREEVQNVEMGFPRIM